MRIDYLPENNSARIKPVISREKAMELLRKYNKEPFHIQHAETVEAVMRYFAQNFGFETEKDFWGLTGLLHDLDFEQFPQEHCLKVQEIFAQENIDPQIERAVVSHGYGHLTTAIPTHFMEKVLYATDELTGLIGAAILMRPSKSTIDLTVSSLKKKYKDRKFAAGCSREVIQKGAEMLGWEIEYLMEITIKAMQHYELASEN